MARKSASPHPLDAALRKFALSPTAWFSGGIDFTYTLPRLFEEIDRNEAAFKSGDAAGIHRVLTVARSYILLAGYAAENFVKGLWVAHAAVSGRTMALGKSPLPQSLGHHRLDVLSVEAKLGLSARELATLKDLRRAIEWWAKYPVPKDAKDFQAFGTGTGEAAKIRDLLRKLERLARAYVANPATPANPKPLWPPDASKAQAGW